MKKTTKRLVSGIVATSMLLSSVLTSNVFADEASVIDEAAVTEVSDVTESESAVSVERKVKTASAVNVQEEAPFEMQKDVMYIQPVIEGQENTNNEVISPELKGSTVNIDFYLKQNPGFSSATFFVKYNPDVIKAKSGNIPKGQGNLGDYITYTAYNEAADADITSAFFANTKINAQIAYVPSAGSTGDYADVSADGTKTAGELGKVKLAGMVPESYVDANNYLKPVEGDGKLFSMTFDVVGEGDANLTIEVVKFGYPPMSGTGSDANAEPIPTENYPNKISVGADTIETTTSEATTVKEETTEATTAEATTKEATTAAPTTEKATEATTKEATTTAPTTEKTTEATTKEATTTAPTTEKATEATTKEATTTAPTTEKATEATTAAPAPSSDTTTAPTTAAPTTQAATVAEVTTVRRSSGGGGGGSSSSAASSSSSSTKKSTATTEAEEATEKTTNDDTESATEKATEATTYVSYNNSSSSEDFFDDIASKPWAAEAINSLAELGIINGQGDRAFAPDANCKRADFAIILVNVLGLDGTASDNFDDVAAGKYYYNAVGLAKEAGVVNGYGDGNFGPENFCTRAELMVMVANALKVTGLDITADESVLAQFSDEASIPVWARPYVAYLVENGIVNGANGVINPNVNITRAEVAVIMFNVVNATNTVSKDAVEEALDGEEESTEVGVEVPAYEDAAYEDASYTEALNTKSEEEIAADEAEKAETEAKAEAEAETEAK